VKPSISILGGLALLAAVPVAANATHKPGHGDGTRSPTISAQPNPVVYGRTTVISGRLRGPERTGKPVTLLGAPYPFADFRTLATAATNGNGDYSFTQRPLANTRYRTRAQGVQSPDLTVLVRIRTSLHVSDSTPRSGQLVTFSGRACPEHDGSLVAIQRRTRTGSWRTVRRTRLRDATRCSVYRRRFRVYRDGTFRAVVAADADHARGISGRRFLDAS
jgi:hypothetical protein